MASSSTNEEEQTWSSGEEEYILQLKCICHDDGVTDIVKSPADKELGIFLIDLYMYIVHKMYHVNEGKLKYAKLNSLPKACP